MEKLNRNKSVIILLAVALVMRLILASFGTLTLDQNTFIAWGRQAAFGGLSSFYNSWSDYLPGYIYVLALLARLEAFLPIPTTVLYKLPAILGDIAVGGLIYRVLGSRKRLALIASAAFVFNPAVLANSTFWGQVDILTALFSLLSIVLLGSPASAVFLAVGVAIKPQAVMTVPVILALGIAKRWRAGDFVKYGLVGLATTFFMFLPFNNQSNLVSFVFERVGMTLGQYPYTSVNAFNFWGLFGFWKEDFFGVNVVVFVCLGLFALIKCKFVLGKPYHFLAILFLANFMFFTRMHERHMLPALVPLVFAAGQTPVLWFVYVGLSLTYIANMYYSYQWVTFDFVEIFPEVLVKLLIVSNLLFFVALVRHTVRPVKVRIIGLVHLIKLVKIRGVDIKIKDRLSAKREKQFIMLIVVFSLVVRIIRLDYPVDDYFDEIYHVFTARQILAGDSKPWHWSSEHPEGFAYEWTHPPLPKEIMAISMGILGVNSFASRLPGALLGVWIILMVYKVAKRLFVSRDIAVLSAFLISTDGLLLTMSRIGTADVYFLAFALTSYYLFLEKRDSGAAVFLGFAAASKWSALWLLPVFLITFVVFRRKLRASLLWFLVFPPIIYLVSYFPMFIFGHDLETFWGMQKQMWWYHSGLKATHPYTSPWWSWPLTLRPVYLFQDYADGVVANIYAMGNPFFFWFGLVGVLTAVWYLIKEKLGALLVLVLGYLVLFAPWAASPRIMFIYHYLPSLPFMAIILAYVLVRHKFIAAPVGVVFLAFVYFFPHWTAIPVPEVWDKTYYWLSSWR